MHILKGTFVFIHEFTKYVSKPSCFSTYIYKYIPTSNPAHVHTFILW